MDFAWHPEHRQRRDLRPMIFDGWGYTPLAQVETSGGTRHDLRESEAFENAELPAE